MLKILRHEHLGVVGETLFFCTTMFKKVCYSYKNILYLHEFDFDLWTSKFLSKYYTHTYQGYYNL